ncbi:MAG TPA: DUF2207 domain-containing protein, partial [Candidatus Paceibacterota bacterium]|nr:DUF2207 domain-containing protein [Candidatus Paceibacterota bacterium]
MRSRSRSGRTKPSALLAALCIAAAFCVPFSVSAESQRIKDYVVHVELAVDGSAAIQEEILYDYGTEQHHGIFRRIPQVFSRADGTQFFIEISDVSVTDGDGNDLLASLEQGNAITMRIGDPDYFVTGTHLYVVRYRVAPIANTLPPDVDEFYWNIVGEDWNFPIDRIASEVVLPREIARPDVRWMCFKGRYGSNTECESDVFPPNSTSTISMVRFLSTDHAPHEGLTISIGIPKGIFDPSLFVVPKMAAAEMKDASQSIPAAVAFPILTLALMGFVWWKYGRDPRGRGAIVVEYEPPENLSPLESGAILDGTVNRKGISAEIVDLARRGFFDIEETEKKGIIFDTKDYQLTRHPNVKSALFPYESILLDALFTHEGRDLAYLRLSQLKEWKKDLNPTISQIDRAVLDALVEKGYYLQNPSKVRGAYLAAGVGLAVIGFFSGSFALGLVLSGVIVGIFAFVMPKTTVQGALIRERVAGFREYLSVAEADRIAFANAPERKPEEFERFLPYAIIFGVEEAWAEQFKSIFEAYPKSGSPTWYHAASQGAFSAAAFSSSLSSFASHTSNAMSSASTSSSGGGGFSGGGM